MGLTILAACGCNIGKVRKNNEDNFYFGGRCLTRENEGLENVIVCRQWLRRGTCMAVFDGMGGEQFGEYASYLAAEELKKSKPTWNERFLQPKEYLQKIALQLDAAVVGLQEEFCTRHMGTTLAGLWFFGRDAYICNLGDSRVYRLRDGVLEQLTVDHVEKRTLRPGRKAPLTQHLGAGSEEIQVEPHISISRVKRGDKYMLCSDGLTDMLSDDEIRDILLNSKTVRCCVETLIHRALAQGGRDNITVIVCRLGSKIRWERKQKRGVKT